MLRKPRTTSHSDPTLAEYTAHMKPYDYESHMANLSDRDIRKRRWREGMPEAENRWLANLSLSGWNKA